MVTQEDIERMERNNDVDGLISALDDKDSFIRRYVSGVLGKFGATSAIEPLIKNLEDADEDVRCEAALALGEIGDIRAIEPLIKALNDRYEYTRSAAAQALGKLCDIRAIQPLENALNDEHDFVRERIIESLDIIKSSNRNKEYLTTQRRQLETQRKKKQMELEIKGFSEKEIDMIINYNYSEKQIIEIRDSGKKIEEIKPILQLTTIHIERVESLGKIESIIGNKVTDDHSLKISDSVIQRSSIGGGIERKINICPYCGEKLNFPETPRFCPYCEKQILN